MQAFITGEPGQAPVPAYDLAHLVAGAGAMLAWASLLVYDATRGPVGTVAATVGGVLQMKPVGVYALTLAYAGLIAVCAAVIGRAVARTARPT